MMWEFLEFDCDLVFCREERKEGKRRASLELFPCYFITMLSFSSTTILPFVTHVVDRKP